MFDKLFHVDLNNLPTWKKRTVRLGQFIIQVFEQFNKEQCVIRASGLAYTSLLAFVPLVAVTFSLFTSFSAFASMKESIQSNLFNFFIPAKGGEILNYINQFADNTKTLGVVGTILLLITAIMLFQNIERSINGVWHIQKQRKFVFKFIIFTSVLLWGTLFIGASFYITGKIRGLMAFEQLMEIGLFSRFVLWLFPLLLSVSAIFLVMMLVPNTKVFLSSAIVGGITGGVLWELGKGAFAHYAAKSVNYSVIYGSLALVPIFLVWLYLTWIIVMLATVTAYVYQNFDSLHRMKTQGSLVGRQRLLISLQIYMLIAGRFFQGKNPATENEINKIFALATHQTRQLLDDFITKNLVHALEDPSTGYVPAKTLDEIPISEMIRSIFASGPDEKDSTLDISTNKLAESLLRRFEKEGYDGLTDQKVADLLRSLGA